MENKNPKKKHFNLTHYNLDRANNSHAIIIVLVGAYLIYMVYFIVKNYIDGETSMKLSTTVIVTIIMIAAAVGCFIYAGVIFYITRNIEEIGREQDEEFGYVHDEEEDEESEDDTGNESLDIKSSASPKEDSDKENSDEGRNQKQPWITREWNRGDGFRKKK